MPLWICKENITLAIAILGFVLSLFSFVWLIAKQRRNLSFSITKASSHDGATYFFMHFVNHSRLPVSITRIVLKHAGREIDCVTIPTFIFDETTRIKGEPIANLRFFSQQIPVQLAELGALSGYILFDDPELTLEAQATQVSFVVATNRGKPLEMTLPLPRR